MTSEIAIRTCTETDWPALIETLDSAFGEEPPPEAQAQWEKLLDMSRLIAATDEDTIVGTGGWIAFDMTVPGGELPVAAVTMVTVRPTHRRRGILRQMMQRQFDDLHAEGVAASILWASEAAIYQRFGYGMAHVKARVDIDRTSAAFLGDPAPVGLTRLISAEEALALLPAIYERARPDIPGSFRRSPLWWELRKLSDTSADRHGGGQMIRILLEIDGQPQGYALYRHHRAWSEYGLPRGSIDILEALGTSPVATREVWRFLFNVDLAAVVSTHRLCSQHPLFLALVDPRQLQLKVSDGTWVRLIDVEKALGARRYGIEGAQTFELVDPQCPWNAGTWTLEAGADGARLRRGTAAPGLRLSAAELSAMYLGTIPCTRLVLAGRVDELVPGAARRADAMFHSDVPPWCLDDF